MRRKWIKLYVDELLRGTTFTELDPAERFCWFGLLILAGDSPTEGRIEIAPGVGYTVSQLCALLRCDAELLERALIKMQRFGKIKVDSNGSIEVVNWKKYQSNYDRKKEVQKRYYQRKKIQRLADDLKLEPPESDGEKEEVRTRMAMIVKRWNEFAAKHGLAQVQTVTKGSRRESQLRARAKDRNFSIDAILEKIAQSDFLLGLRSDWKVTFDWILSPTNYVKVLDGNYNNKPSQAMTLKDKFLKTGEER